MNRSVLFWIWLIAAVLWIGAVAYYASGSAPIFSLDLGNDEGTRMAYDRAVVWHWARAAVMALLPPAVVLVIMRAVFRA